MSFSTALVTGASGFIGRALVESLCAEGVDVTCLGRSLARLPDHGRPLLVPSFRSEALARALDGHRFDVVFHLAAYGVAPEDRDAQATFDVNLHATHSIIQTVAAGGCRAFLYAGSCSEYCAAPDGSRLTEEHPLSCLSTYGASKAAAGLWGSALAKSLAMPFQWMRLFGVFGPGEASYRLVPYLIQRLRRGASVDLTPGEQWRDFLYIHDAVRGLRGGADAALRGVLGPFNLCSGRPVTVSTVARMVADRLGANPDLLGFGKRNYRPEEAMWMVGDATAFARATGFEPLVPLEEGIARMVAYEPNH